LKLAHIQTFDSWRSSSSFRFLFLGNICSNGAQWLQLFTAGWLVQTLSADLATTGLLVALVGGINLLPSLLIGPIGGVLGDRLNRKYLIMSLQGFMACVAWFFAFWNTTDYVEVWHVIAYVVISGSCLCITQPIRNALIATTVPRDLIGNAMATNVFTITGTRLITPFVGGILIANLGFSWNFAIEAMLYMGTIFFLIPFKGSNPSSNTIKEKLRIFSGLKEGLVYLWKVDRALLNLIVLTVIPELLLHPVWFLLPIFTAEVLLQGPEIGGYLFAVTGLGGFFSPLITSSFGYVFKKGHIVLGTTILSSISVILFAYSNWMPAAFFLIFIMAFAQSFFRTTNGALIQSLVPDHLRSRISTLHFYVKGFVILSAIGAGWLIDLTSVRVGIACLGTMGLILGIYFTITFHRVRKLL